MVLLGPGRGPVSELLVDQPPKGVRGFEQGVVSRVGADPVSKAGAGSGHRGQLLVVLSGHQQDGHARPLGFERWHAAGAERSQNAGEGRRVVRQAHCPLRGALRGGQRRLRSKQRQLLPGVDEARKAGALELRGQSRLPGDALTALEIRIEAEVRPDGDHAPHAARVPASDAQRQTPAQRVAGDEGRLGQLGSQRVDGLPEAFGDVPRGLPVAEQPRCTHAGSGLQ